MYIYIYAYLAARRGRGTQGSPASLAICFHMGTLDSSFAQSVPARSCFEHKWLFVLQSLRWFPPGDSCVIPSTG